VAADAPAGRAEAVAARMFLDSLGLFFLFCFATSE
jgi:hypothetical protein